MFRLFKSALTARSCEGSTERLIQLCGGYFAAYVMTGVIVKFFTPRLMSDVGYLIYSTIGGSAVCVTVVFALGWYKLKSTHNTKVFGINVPAEYVYIIPSGVCTAVVIPTTTLMYTLPISVMVAMVIMRASIIIISRIIDAIQIHQGILKRKVYKEENIAVVFAIIAAGMNLVNVKPGEFDFVHNRAAMTILTSYLIAYSIRIYIMNYYKNTRPKGAPQDNQGFFAIEQIAASLTTITVAVWVFTCLCPDDPKSFIALFQQNLSNPPQAWGWA
ncbi:MAG: hypothetical protein WCS77_11005, partial [Elusimicrobiaceae bacterium]